MPRTRLSMCGALLFASTSLWAQPAPGDATSRSVLPVPARAFEGKMAPSLDASKPSWAPPIKAPANAPNILLIMTDDVGFGAAGTFGGPVPTPNLDRLAAAGARYTNFHTTAMCSPTRAALLTGRNHHAVGMGALTDLAMGFPGYSGEMPASAATIARVLKGNGYNTAFFGKHHDVPTSEESAAGPFTRWPTGLGFEEFYGFIGAETDQWNPTLFHGTDPVPVGSRRPGMILEEDLANHAIGWLHQQHAAAPDKPFFIYYAPGTAHAPQQAPADWIAKFRSQFDRGWDVLRSETVARQIAAGIVPPGTAVTPRPEGLPAWSSLDRDHQRLYARYMEVFAAMLAYQDHQFGRIMDELDRMGQLKNTLIVFIEGDNGATAEAGPLGTLNEMAKLSGQPDKSFSEQLADIDEMGGPKTYEVYPAGWAWALNAPFPQFKQVASHLGGTRNGMVINWAGHVAAPGTIRTQFGHVVDVMPTLLEAAGVPAPKIVDGTPQQPLDGVSMLDTLSSPHAASRHRVQYFELLGNRAIYQDGWLANTNPGREPWQFHSAMPPEAFTWSLYDLKTDFAQAHDLAAAQPGRLAAMKALFDKEAHRNNVYPLRADLDPIRTFQMRRPSEQRNDYVFWGGDVNLTFSTQPFLRGPFSIETDLELPKEAHGAILATGSSLGGWSFYLDRGRPTVVHSASSAAVDQFMIQAATALPAGAAHLAFRFTPDGTPLTSGGTMAIFAGGRTIASGRIGRVSLLPAGMNEQFNVGNDTGRPVASYGPEGPRFNGSIRRVELKLGRPTN